MSEIKRGKYIVFEGGEHTGKSTQARILAERIGGLLTREPGGTSLGSHVRSLLLDPEIETSGLTEVFLFAADRAELMETLVRPTLAESQHVVSDRSWISSAAYQHARGIPMDVIRSVNSRAVGDMFVPDVLLLFDADPVELLKRRTETPDWFEQMDSTFHNNVRYNFLAVAKPLGAHVIDATMSVEDVSEAVWEVVALRLED